MKRYQVTVRTESINTTYSAIGHDAFAVHADALDRFGVGYIGVVPA